MPKTKNNNLPKDYRYALMLGFLIGVFLLPVENNLRGAEILYLKVSTLIFFPLVSFAGIYFAKLAIGRFAGLWQFCKFLLIGLANTAINVGVLNYLIIITGRSSGFALSVIGATSFMAAVVNSYIWNTHWSFRKERNHSTKQFHRFLIITFTALLLNAIIIAVGERLLHGSSESLTLQANIADIFALIASTFWNFFGYKYWVFKKK